MSENLTQLIAETGSLGWFKQLGSAVFLGTQLASGRIKGGTEDTDRYGAFGPAVLSHPSAQPSHLQGLGNNRCTICNSSIQ